MLGEILSIQPGELKFPFELKKQVSTTLRLSNVTSEFVAFKVKTTSPKKYCVRPNTGTIPPQGSIEVVVTMQAQKEAPSDLQCKDKFLVQSVLLPGTTKDSVQDYWSRESGLDVQDVKLRVVFIAPPQPPSPVAESAEEGTVNPSPFPLAPAATSVKALTPDQNMRDASEYKAKYTEAKSQLTSLVEEKNSLLREIQALRAQQPQLHSGPKPSSPVQQQKPRGWSTIMLMFVSLIFLLLGYYVGRLPLPAIGAGEDGGKEL